MHIDRIVPGQIHNPSPPRSAHVDDAERARALSPEEQFDDCYGAPVHVGDHDEPVTGRRRRRRPRRSLLATALVLAAMTSSAACSDADDAAQAVFRPVEAGVLRIATALPAPGFWDGDDPASVDGGFEWELATLLAERFGLALEVVEVPFAQLDAGDLAGADLAIAQITATTERAARVDFSIGYFDTAIGVLARTGIDIADLREARELQWAVVDGSTQQDFLDDVVDPTRPALVVADETTAAKAVADGRADAGLADLATALVIAGARSDIEVVAQFVTRQRYAVAIPADGPDHTANRDAVSTAIRALEASGTLDELVERWLEPRFERNPDRVPVIIARTPRSSP
jgi:polar amino acid transport system substrate-binding protein